MKASALSLFILVLAAMLVGMASRIASADEQIPVSFTYKVYCSRCHGDTGQGDGPDAASLSTKPRDFADCAVMSKISDQTIVKAIKNGGAAVGLSREMPAWGVALSNDKIGALAKFVRTFCVKK